MIGIIFLYYIGKQFYELAHEYNKSQWGFAILGVISFYFGSFLAGICMGLLDIAFGTDYVTTTSEVVLSFIGMPFGFLTCWGLYKILKNKWSKKAVISDSEILDDQFIS